MSFRCGLFFLGVLGCVLQASALDRVPSVKLESLQSFSSHTVPANRPALLYFFQPDCASCARQKKELSCVPEGVDVFSIGVFGSKPELAKEARKHNLQGTLLYGGKKAERLFEITQTPTLLFYNKDGKLFHRANQLLTCAELRKFSWP